VHVCTVVAVSVAKDAQENKSDSIPCMQESFNDFTSILKEREHSQSEYSPAENN
jgi:hypothetical protein